MHRTQIILEDWQYQALRAKAESEGRSISSLVRDLLSAALAPPARKRKALNDMEGVGEHPAAYGRDHDRFLYGVKDED